MLLHPHRYVNPDTVTPIMLHSLPEQRDGGEAVPLKTAHAQRLNDATEEAAFNTRYYNALEMDRRASPYAASSYL
ncbi:hypothetical protein NDU88_001327 [Pleurodeles waltl]|uniref:Uncharacterized protein n=1 Tax=Pleurodeles waltl TaxID=8319 RepID=A0AAV7U7K8_PLEWA|nr:hypothetical protein NDU88_001327 [Pleurodeles waltl]